MHSIKQLQSVFHQRDWEKGHRMYQAGFVLDITYDEELHMLSGEIESERGAGSYDSFLDWGMKDILSDCSCPVGGFCKHTAAMVHALLAQRQQSKGASERDISRWLQQFETPQKKPTENEEILLFFLDNKQAGELKGVQVSVKSSRRLKSGQLSKSLRGQYISEHFLRASSLSEQDRHLCADLLANKTPFDMVESYALLEKLIATGRCYWQNINNPPLTLHKNKQARLGWQHKDHCYALKVTIDGTPSAQVLQCLPLAYVDTEQMQLGQLEFTLPPGKVKTLLAAPPMSGEQLSHIWPQVEQLLNTETQLPLPQGIRATRPEAPVPRLSFVSPPNNPDSSRALLSFDYQGKGISPHSQDNQLTGDNGEILYRHQAFEQQAIERLTEAGFKPVAAYQQHWRAPDFELRLKKQQWYPILHQLVPELESEGWKIEFSPDFHFQLLESDGHIEAEFEQQDNDYLSLAMNIDVDGHKMPLFPILHSAIEQLPADHWQQNESQNREYEEKIVYVELQPGQCLPLALKTVKPLIDQFIELFMPGRLNKDGSLKLSKHVSHHALGILNNQGITSGGEGKLRNMAERLRHFDGIQPVPCPDTLHTELREYQQNGLNWIQFLREYELAGILADDMGLGKTLQALANLCIEKQQRRLTTPALVLAPTSVIFNWQAEAKRFAPNLKTRVIYGNQRQSLLQDVTGLDLLITSYALLPKDIAHYQETTFHYLILDEAQYIKNPKTKLYAELLNLRATHKLCLTGTPIENHLGELWSQFNFLLPGLLGNQQQFNHLFRNPIEKKHDRQRLQLLNERIAPFILRRTKDRIARELPAKTEILRPIKIQGKQAQLYENVRLAVDDKLRQVIAAKGLAKSQIEILDAMLKLRQVCCHPQLLPGNMCKNITQSAKLDVLMQMLPELIEDGRRILVFSQFTSMLALIEPALKQAEIPYVTLTGATRNREAIINSFKDGEVPLFLISLKAGGTGLNLTEADTVIHYDPWWNPAVENQATDRIHRIGQNKPVFVYKLIIEGSIEEKIQHLQQHKSHLAKAILSDRLSDTGTTLDQTNLKALLQPLSHFVSPPPKSPSH
ncbi:DEAD/DEAH box helicase [Lacimicrobium alkaliphilum]|uniref:Helicase n=1 Tax=Lacimicrobium alkaliphilum TaxID=1526571 RepID=A0ABQ1RHB0_9ALTE|nr:DEAD/DEAH box helicase [Lacimicrobium alkaliphilum]GGD70463.1 helicase [Lacimicrobium alkaliphilum]